MLLVHEEILLVGTKSVLGLNYLGIGVGYASALYLWA
jgi:hypothetical protein